MLNMKYIILIKRYKLIWRLVAFYVLQDLCWQANSQTLVLFQATTLLPTAPFYSTEANSPPNTFDLVIMPTTPYFNHLSTRRIIFTTLASPSIISFFYTFPTPTRLAATNISANFETLTTIYTTTTSDINVLTSLANKNIVSANTISATATIPILNSESFSSIVTSSVIIGNRTALAESNALQASSSDTRIIYVAIGVGIFAAIILILIAMFCIAVCCWKTAAKPKNIDMIMQNQQAKNDYANSLNTFIRPYQIDNNDNWSTTYALVRHDAQSRYETTNSVVHGSNTSISEDVYKNSDGLEIPQKVEVFS